MNAPAVPLYAGEAAADLVLEVVSLAEGALANKTNIYNLQQRVVDLPQLLSENQQLDSVTYLQLPRKLSGSLKVNIGKDLKSTPTAYNSAR